MKLYKGINSKKNRFREDFFDEPIYLVGYSAVIEQLNLSIPQPRILALISDSKKVTNQNNWKVYRERYLPDDHLYAHLQFALKYEGVNILIFKKIFEHLNINEVTQLVNFKKAGQYSRKIWFLYEWLMDEELDITDLDSKKGYIPLINEKVQFASAGEKIKRQMVINNLLGEKNYCPCVYKTEKIQAHINNKYNQQLVDSIQGLNNDIIHRASAYISLKDSQSSFFIEGEDPPQNKSQRWAKAIAQAGKNNLDKDELERLQIIILGDDNRFLELGYRKKGGWIGERNRISNQPIPEHISAKDSDLDELMNDWMTMTKNLTYDKVDPIVVAAIVGFGFVFIHPLEDGNGRLHRYLFHHVISKMEYSPQGMIFPLSFVILENIESYEKVLKDYSEPLLSYIQYDITDDLNVEVTNDTKDYYSYWDATTQVEFLFDRVKETVEKTIPEELKYIQNYDEFKSTINEQFTIPDQKLTLLNNFLYQNQGKLSKRKREKEFAAFTDEEVKKIEGIYQEIFES